MGREAWDGGIDFEVISPEMAIKATKLDEATWVITEAEMRFQDGDQVHPSTSRRGRVGI